MRRVVLDTNVVVSALYGGRVARILARWRAGAFVLCVSDGVIAEYRDVMARFPAFGGEADTFFAMLTDRRYALTVTPDQAIRAVPADPDDDIFLACAAAAEADLIVSGDHHLLDLGEFRGIPIVRPAEAVEVLEGPPEAGGGEEQ